MNNVKVFLRKAMPLALFSGFAFAVNGQAQESTPGGGGGQADDDAQIIEEIQVIGYRDSLKRNLSIKRGSDTIVDAISAEDVGQFPDLNIADALQRITGVQVEKDERDGEGVRISIRGTPSHLNLAFLNNQQIASATASNRRTELRDRSFNYYLLPTEILDTVEVYKTPEANIDEGSMGGTVIVRTRKPLDAEANSGAVQARWFRFDNADENEPYISGLYSWKNEAETFGINAAFVSRDSATLMDSKRNTAGYFGYIPYDANDGQSARSPARVGNNRYTADRSLQTPFVTLQFAPSDDLDITLTALNSVTETESQGIYSFGFTIQGLFGRLAAQPAYPMTELGFSDGTVVSASLPNCCTTVNWGSAVYDTGFYEDEVETTAFELETTLERDTYSVTVQAGHSFADGLAIDKAAQFYAPSTLGFDISSGIMEWTHDADLTPDDYRFWYSHINTIRNDSDSTFVQADGKIELNNDFFSSIEAGVKYREYNKGASRVKRDFVEEGTLAQFAGPLLTGFNVGNAPMQLYRFNVGDFERWQNSQPEVAGTGNSSWTDPNDRFDVSEDVVAAYLKVNFDTGDFRGNAGLRLVRTSTTAEASQYTGRNFNAERRNAIRPVVTENDYTEILPSLNLSYVGFEDVVLRFAAAEVMARPNYVSIAPFETRNCGSRGCTGFEGNPDLDPYRASQFDISAEWYFADTSYLALALFHKDVKSFIDIESFTATRIYWTEVNGMEVEQSREFALERPINGEGLTIQGFELSYQQEIGLGFGVQANYTYSDADLTQTEAQMDKGQEPVLFGHSEDTWNLSLYYQRYGLTARLSYTFRSEYASNHLQGASVLTSTQAAAGTPGGVGNELGFGLGVSRGLIGYKGDFGQFDFNASYHITDNIEALFQVINLGDEEIEWYASREDHTADQGRPIGLYNHGRRFALGVNVKF